jgi:hypothetical protein
MKPYRKLIAYHYAGPGLPGGLEQITGNSTTLSDKPATLGWVNNQKRLIAKALGVKEHADRVVILNIMDLVYGDE